MSSRQDLKGSSRSARDDSRRYERRYDERRYEDRGYDDRRDRSRSPTSRRHPRYSPDRSDRHRVDYKSSSSHRRHSENDSEEDVPAPPPPPRITKISIGFSKPKVAPIKLNVGGPSKLSSGPKPSVASIFNTDDDDEPEEMPAEAKMRMRNIGRDTPTSAGPNSFGKTKQGFCDSKKVFEKNLKQQLEGSEDKPKISSLPQTIYKIKGP